jgi:hypothetical protein
MKKKAKTIVEVVAFFGLIYWLWDFNIPVSDNIAMMIPLLFIYGLMYLILR